MKIVKRDGRIVEYEPKKIETAILKANNEVSIEERISQKDIIDIIKFIEKTYQKKVLVEDIQDIIELKLMEKGKFVLAKKYIIYRYTRSLIRKSNTTDSNILSLLKNNNSKESNIISACMQRDLMAGEVSKDLAYRILLPKNIVTAIRKNYLDFCYTEYFTEPIIESCFINFNDIFENGTCINGIQIDTPKNFQSACNIMCEVIANCFETQTGNIYINFHDLIPFYKLTYNKIYSLYRSTLSGKLNSSFIDAIVKKHVFEEIKSGIQTLFYEINTLCSSKGKVPKVYFLINTNDIKDSYEENIVYEFIRQKLKGFNVLESENKLIEFPKIIYCINEENYLSNSKFYYITEEILKINSGIWFMNNKVYKSFFQKIKKFNQGTITINLAKIALDSINDKNMFFKNLDEILNISYEGFLCRNHNLQGIKVEKSPIHWQNGVISRLISGEKIDNLLKKAYSYLNFSIIGFSEAMIIMNFDEIAIKKVCTTINEYVIKWNKENSFEILTSNNVSNNIKTNLFNKDSDIYKEYKIYGYNENYNLISSQLSCDFTYYKYSDESNLLTQNFIFIK